MTITTTALEPLELPMPEPEDDPADPYPEFGSRDEFERAQWFGERVKPHWPEWFEELDESEIPF